jgi:hypothetical protein
MRQTVDGTLLETITCGKKRPLDPGHKEQAWAKKQESTFCNR